MTSFYRYLVCLFFIVFIHSGQSEAQVSTSDSLALVDLYNATSGNAWNYRNNWLSGNVGSWFGITVSSGRVSEINLSGNNLSGTLPASFCDLTKLHYLYLANNNLSGNLPVCFDNIVELNSIDLRNNGFTGTIPSGLTSFTLLADLLITDNQFDELPDLSSLTEFSNLIVQNNQFTFEDLIPNMSVQNFQYTPQDSINSRKDTLIEIKDTITLQVSINGSGHQFQWMKNGILLQESLHYVGTNTSSLTINKIDLPDSGAYICIVTHPAVTGLSIIRRPVIINVNDTRLSQNISVLPGNNYYCGEDPLKINASASSSLPLSFQLLTGNTLLTEDTLTPCRPGSISVRILQAGDDNYQPVQKDTTFFVLTPIDSSFQIVQTIPDDNNDLLELSVTNKTGIDYLWINPRLDTTYSYLYSRSPADEKDIGSYTIQAGKNNCFYFSETISISFSSSIIAYELVSPNGDGRNDYFYVHTIEKYTDSEVQVFNAWSQLVYKKTNYLNDWSGEELPGGTYYYLVKIPSQNKELKGSVYLKK